MNRPAAPATSYEKLRAAIVRGEIAPNSRLVESDVVTIHAPLTPEERWPLVQQETHAPLQLTAGTDANGVASPLARKERMRAKLSHFYFRDRVAPPTPSELAAAQHEHGDGHHEAAVVAEIESAETAGEAATESTASTPTH